MTQARELPKIMYRRMQHADIPGVQDLASRTSKSEVAWRDWEDDALLRRLIDAPWTMPFVALADGHIVGVVFLGDTGTRLLLNHLCVDPSARRRGIGQELVRCALKEMYQISPVRHVIALVRGNNPLGMEFWQKVDGFKDETVCDDIHSFCMDLDPSGSPWLTD